MRQALTLTEPELRAVHGDQIAWHSFCEWSRREGRVLARRQERFGALVLADQPWPDAPAEAMARAALEGLRQIDSVAYIRFASVYRDFSEARDFEEFASTVQQAAKE